MNMENKKTTVGKTKEGYGYKYTELADINKYCEANGIQYYQEIETNELNQKDYIVTYVTENGVEKKVRGCQIVEAKLSGINNPVQAYGSSLTYCRRYSLLLSLGLATEDTDAAELGEITKEIAEAYTFKGGKHDGWTLKQVVEKDKNFLKWLLANTKDERLLEMIKLLTGEVPKTDEEYDERFDLKAEFGVLLAESETDLDKILEHYKKDTSDELTIEELKDAIEKMKKKVGKNE